MSTEEISLRPAGPADRATAYRWLVEAYKLPFFSPGEAIPSWERYCEDYAPLFFNQSQSERAGAVVVLVDGKEAGFISHDARFSPPGAVDLDIWMYGEGYCSHGYGTRALGLLVKRLAAGGLFQMLVMCPSASNQRAVRAYLKNGFEVLDPDEARAQGLADRLDCDDGLVMLKYI